MTDGAIHELQVVHRRRPHSTLSDYEAPSRADIEVESYDLVGAWEELIARLPSETSAALMTAVGRIEERGRQGT